jgi:hypothetical protein
VLPRRQVVADDLADEVERGLGLGSAHEAGECKPSARVRPGFSSAPPVPARDRPPGLWAADLEQVAIGEVLESGGREALRRAFDGVC